jgi:photosystem II stability/assembly factor-like uncharacterized protein
MALMRWALMRWLAALIFLFVGPSSAQFAVFQVNGAAAVTTWQTPKIGAGGQLTGISIAPDGTKVVRTDTYGGYVWNASAPSPGNAGGLGTWQQLVTTTSMPVGDWSLNAHQGIYEITVAPSSTSTIYMMWNGFMYKSTNTGVTWTRLSSFSQISPVPDPNNPTFKLFGRYMAVDPQNANIVYVGTPSGSLWVTTDGGTTWSAVSGLTAPTSTGGYLIAFDPNSGVSGGKKQGIYVSSYGTGVYHSTDGGSTWSLLNSAGMPTTHRHMIVSASGVVFLTDNSASATNLHKFSSGTWSLTSASINGGTGHSIAQDPVTTANIFLGGDGQSVGAVSTDGGTTWVTMTTVATRSASDIPWLQFALETYQTNGDVAFDPSLTSTLYFAEGIGAWKLANPPTTNTAYTITSQSAGIEQLVGQTVVAPPSGKPFVLAQDRPEFYSNSPTVYPSSYGPEASPTTPSINHGWDADCVAATPTTCIIMINAGGAGDKSGISTDGGQTWTQFAGKPAAIAGNGGGGMAASSTTNFLWCENGNGDLYNTTNGGTSWGKITISGVPASPSETGWGFSAFSYNRICAADRVDATTFYAYNYGPTGAASAAGIYKSTDGGANWTHVYSTSLATPSGGLGTSGPTTLRAVPGQSGHLFFSSGFSDGSVHPVNTNLMRSTDHGATWAAVPVSCSGSTCFKEVACFDFGVTYSGQSYPSIFVVGWLNNVYGIYRSIDNAVTWVNVGDYPNGSFDAPRGCAADKVNQGWFYIAYAGSGWKLGKTNYLLNRDLAPAANDNTPMWINKVA